MNRCLGERALLALHFTAGNARAHAHLRLCADCAERYEALVDDLEVIGTSLAGPPPARMRRHALPLRPRVLAAAALGTVLAFAIGITAVRRPAPPQSATRSNTLSAFAADVSEALFPNAGVSDLPQLASDAPYLRAALEVEWPCTQDRFLDGECGDQLSALLFEDN